MLHYFDKVLQPGKKRKKKEVKQKEINKFISKYS